MTDINPQRLDSETNGTNAACAECVSGDCPAVHDSDSIPLNNASPNASTGNKRLIVSPARCIGCKSCELACSYVHTDNAAQPAPSRIKVYTYTEDRNMIVVCQQCDDAACVRTCPSGALLINTQSGAVEWDKGKCLGCGMCAIACPFGSLTFIRESTQVLKCDLCGGDPACARYCPTSALEFAAEPSLKPIPREVKPLPGVPWKIKPDLKKWRRITQVGLGMLFTNSFVAVLWSKSIYEGPLRSVCIPGLNCHSCPFAVLSCPIGIIQYHMAIHLFPFYVLGYLALIGILFGRAACGWICPFGWIQDAMYNIRAKFKFGIPKWLNHFKWVSLILLVIVLPYLTAVHWFSKLCPYGALIGAIPWAAWNPIHPVLDEPVIEPGSFGLWFWIKMAILAGFLIWFVIAKRPFCRVVCPMGLIFSWFNRVSLLKIEAEKSHCSNCKLCSDLCPMGLDVINELETQNCIKCLDCTACDRITAKFNFDYGWSKNKLLNFIHKKKEIPFPHKEAV